jgi:hypothetical protein
MLWMFQGRTTTVSTSERGRAGGVRGCAVGGTSEMRRLSFGSKLFVFVAAFILALTDNPSAWAGTIYTDRAAFEAATPGGANFNFDSLSPINDFRYYHDSVTTNGVTFSSSLASLFALGRDYVGGVSAFGSANVVLQYNNNTSNITAILPPGTHAFGVDLGGGVLRDQKFASGKATVTVSTGDSFIVDVPDQPGLNFVGFTSDQEISSITFFSNNFDDYNLTFADFRLGPTVADAPEPASLTLCGIGALGLCVYGWRRRRLAAPPPA